MRHSFILLAAASVAALILSGCARNEAAEPKAAPLPQVSVAPVIARKVTEFDELTGRFEAVERVEIRPRVSGYISSVNFTEGSEVKKADVLFVRRVCSPSTPSRRRSTTPAPPGASRRRPTPRPRRRRWMRPTSTSPSRV